VLLIDIRKNSLVLLYSVENIETMFRTFIFLLKIPSLRVRGHFGFDDLFMSANLKLILSFLWFIQSDFFRSFVDNLVFCNCCMYVYVGSPFVQWFPHVHVHSLPVASEEDQHEHELISDL